MVFVHFKVAFDLDDQRYSGMVHDLFEHVIENFSPGVDVRRPAAVQVDRHADIRSRVLRDFGGAFAGAQELPDAVPVVGDQHAVLRKAPFGQYRAPASTGCNQDSLCAEISGQFDVGRAVAG